jgi:hypothetical protein
LTEGCPQDLERGERNALRRSSFAVADSITTVTSTTGSTGVTISVLPGATVSTTARAIGLNGNASSVSNQGAIRTSGFNAFGLATTGVGNTLSSAGSIATTGARGHGISATGSNSTLINSGTIAVSGAGASGIRSTETTTATSITKQRQHHSKRRRQSRAGASDFRQRRLAVGGHVAIGRSARPSRVRVFSPRSRPGCRSRSGGRFAIEPQAQLIYQHLGLNSTQDALSSIGFAPSDVVNGRVGARLFGTFGSGTAIWTPYLKSDVWWSTAGVDDVAFGDNVVSTARGGGAAVDVGGGIAGRLTKSVSLYGEGGYRTAVDGSQTIYRGNLGLRVSW